MKNYWAIIFFIFESMRLVQRAYCLAEGCSPSFATNVLSFMPCLEMGVISKYWTPIALVMAALAALNWSISALI